MLGSFRSDREPVKLAGKTNSEVADVNHLLHFAESFGADFSDFDLNKIGESIFMLAQLNAKMTNDFTAHRCWDTSPGLENFAGDSHCLIDRGLSQFVRNRTQYFSVDGRANTY